MMPHSVLILLTALAQIAAQNTTAATDQQVAPRIVGGVDAYEDFRYAVAFFRDDVFFPNYPFCGGTLIAPDKVLTAAHCNLRPNDIALIGARSLANWDRAPFPPGGRPEKISVWFSTTHPDYSYNDWNDVALVTLASSASLAPVSVAASTPPAGASTTAVGWGRLWEGGPSPDHLQQVSVPVQPLQYCNGGGISMNPGPAGGDICAGFLAGGSDACQGDSGGPLLWNVGGAYQLVGVVSRGIGCARQGYPGVYADATRYRTWLGLAPTPRPTPQPTRSPTRSPTVPSVPAAPRCSDAPKRTRPKPVLLSSGARKNCEWVRRREAALPGDICGKYLVARERCPSACNLCGRRDSTQRKAVKFVTKQRKAKRDCAWIKEDLVQRCAKFPKAREQCPVLCYRPWGCEDEPGAYCDGVFNDWRTKYNGWFRPYAQTLCGTDPDAERRCPVTCGSTGANNECGCHDRMGFVVDTNNDGVGDTRCKTLRKNAQSKCDANEAAGGNAKEVCRRTCDTCNL